MVPMRNLWYLYLYQFLVTQTFTNWNYSLDPLTMYCISDHISCKWNKIIILT